MIRSEKSIRVDRPIHEEGVERTLALDLIRPFLPTNLLAPRLRASQPARIANVSSGGMHTQRIRVDDLRFGRRKRVPARSSGRPPPPRGSSGWTASPAPPVFFPAPMRRSRKQNGFGTNWRNSPTGKGRPGPGQASPPPGPEIVFPLSKD